MLTTEIGTEAAMIAAEIVLKVTVLMLVAAAAGWMLRSRSASLRYALGVATMAAVLCVAPVAVVGPRIEVRALDGVVEWWEARRALAVTVLEDGEDPGRVARDLDPVRIAEVGPVQRTWPLAAVPEPSRGIPWLPVL